KNILGVRSRSTNEPSQSTLKWRIVFLIHQEELILTCAVEEQDLIILESTKVAYWEESVRRPKGNDRGNPIKE
ncbi:MAG: hypothetical protein ACUVWO_15995, partial [Thermodesulfobacteriota bacterium]